MAPYLLVRGSVSTTISRSLGFSVLLGFALACDPPAETLEPIAERHPLGKADAAGSCVADDAADFCGGQSRGACWCDDLCSGYGDCCSDYQDVCFGSDDASSTDGGTNGSGEAPPSIWDDALQAGTPITGAEAVSLFEPGATLAPCVRVVAA